MRNLRNSPIFYCSGLCGTGQPGLYRNGSLICNSFINCGPNGEFVS